MMRYSTNHTCWAARANKMRLSVLTVSAMTFLTGCGNGGGGSAFVGSPSGGGGAATASVISTTASAANSAKSSTTLAGTGCTAATYTPNFALENDPTSNLPNQLYHWSSLPARVYFVPGDWLTTARKAQAMAGFDWWGLALGLSGMYQEVTSRSKANIVVQYEARGETGYGAITEYHFDSKSQLLDANITFNMTYLAGIDNITPVAAHEFGHALGIAGHSNDTQDVMSSTPAVYSMTALAARDVNTLKTAYCGLPAVAVAGSASSGISKGTAQSAVFVACQFGTSAKSGQ